MCKAKSFICIKNEQSPRYSVKHDSHTKLIQQLGLKDDKLANRNFVKIEYVPKDRNWFSPELSDQNKWEFIVDEEESIPGWFESDKTLWQDRCWNIISKIILPALERGVFLGDLHIYPSAKLDAPALESVSGNLYIYPSAKLDALKSVSGDLYISNDAKLDAPALESVSGNLYIYSSVKLDALKSVSGNLHIYSSAKLDAPALESVSGNLYIYPSVKLDAPALKRK